MATHGLFVFALQALPGEAAPRRPFPDRFPFPQMA
jgi:hypothetical protein